MIPNIRCLPAWVIRFPLRRLVYEDTDLAFKVQKAGYKVLYQPLSEVSLRGRNRGN